uniref:Protein Nef n=1 Tax=Simian immunodeficiency virus TaxID=11723 RepID=A0A1W6I4S7_SIV|nr:nef protein [Simian immunodeficiency virus]
MGSASSKQQLHRPSTGWRSSPGRGQTRYWKLFGDLLGESSTSRGESARGSRSCSTNHPQDQERRGEAQPLCLTQGEKWEDDDEGVGFPVRPQRPLTPMYYKKAIDFSWFLKEKGGLEGINYNQRRHDLLNLYALNEHGILSDWQHYTDGPGERYPTCFGVLWKLVPVVLDPGIMHNDRHMLMHPLCSADVEDPWRENLVWRFDPTLAWETGLIKAAKQRAAKQAIAETLADTDEEEELLSLTGCCQLNRKPHPM